MKVRPADPAAPTVVMWYSEDMAKLQDPEKRFWAKVVKGEGCWIWTGAKTRFGYGKFTLPKGSAQMMAHRFAWTLTNGPIPEGLQACHACDNPSCVRPDHLWLGTAKENKQDSVRKGRIPRGDASWARRHPELLPRGDNHHARLRPERLARGERNGKAKLSNEEVRKIRDLYAAGKFSHADLARMFNASKTGISHIVNRRTRADA